MAFAAILRRSAQKAAPLARTLVGTNINTHSAVKSAVFSAVKSATVTPRFTRPAAFSVGRHFCSSNANNDDDEDSTPYTDKDLLEVLQSEVDCVEQGEDFGKTVDPPGEFPFEIVDKAGEQTVTLTREYDDENITVEVSMPNLITGEEDEEDDDDDEEGTASTVPLLVNITKKVGKGPYLEFDCSAFPDGIQINGLSLKNPETEDALAYEGPDFGDLDENLQKSFHKYLEIRGIKPSTINFLHEYMIEKDNMEYLRWLKDVKSFVEA